MQANQSSITAPVPQDKASSTDCSTSLEDVASYVRSDHRSGLPYTQRHNNTLESLNVIAACDLHDHLDPFRDSQSYESLAGMSQSDTAPKNQMRLPSISGDNVFTDKSMLHPSSECLTSSSRVELTRSRSFDCLHSRVEPDCEALRTSHATTKIHNEICNLIHSNLPREHHSNSVHAYSQNSDACSLKTQASCNVFEQVARPGLDRGLDRQGTGGSADTLPVYRDFVHCAGCNQNVQSQAPQCSCGMTSRKHTCETSSAKSEQRKTSAYMMHEPEKDHLPESVPDTTFYIRSAHTALSYTSTVESKSSGVSLKIGKTARRPQSISYLPVANRNAGSVLGSSSVSHDHMHRHTCSAIGSRHLATKIKENDVAHTQQSVDPLETVVKAKKRLSLPSKIPAIKMSLRDRFKKLVGINVSDTSLSNRMISSEINLSDPQSFVQESRRKSRNGQT